MNIVLFGAPGAGKGTQSSLLVSRDKMVQISTGDLFRAAIKNNTSLGVEAKAYMDKGELVPDSIVIGMVKEAVQKQSGVDFILDGFPRNIQQATELKKMLAGLGLKIGKAVFLEVPQQMLVSRLTGRRVCENCGTVYHVESKPPQKEGACDKCGGKVVQRADDKESVVITRLRVYEESTAPLKLFFKEQGLLQEVNGDQDPEVVFGLIKRAMN